MSNVFIEQNTELKVGFQHFINLVSCDFGKTFPIYPLPVTTPGDQKDPFAMKVWTKPYSNLRQIHTQQSERSIIKNSKLQLLYHRESFAKKMK